MSEPTVVDPKAVTSHLSAPSGDEGFAGDMHKLFKQTKGDVPERNKPKEEEEGVTPITEGLGEEKPPVTEKGGKGFIKSQKEIAQKAQKEAEEARKRAQELEARVQELEAQKTKITELEEQLKTYRPASEVAEIEKERNELKETYETTSKKLTEAQQRADFYDYANGEEFQTTYQAPVSQAWGTVANIVGSDPERSALLGRIGNANEVAMQAASPEARKAAEDERDALIEEVSSGLVGFKQRQFDAAINSVLERTAAAHEALRNWKTNVARDKDLRAERDRLAKEAVRKTWEDGYARAEEGIAQDLVIPEDLKSMVTEPDGMDALIAKNIIAGNPNISTSDMTRLLKQGESYKVVVSQKNALLKQNAELKQTIATLRGESTTGNAGVHSAESHQRQKTEQEIFEEEGQNLVKEFFTRK